MRKAIKEKIKKHSWERWLQRPFTPLVTSFFAESLTKESFNKIGLPGLEGRAQLYQKGIWYSSKYFFEDFGNKIEIYLKKYSVFDITDSLDRFYKKNKKRIKILAKQKKDPREQFKEIYEILTLCTTYIWMAHGLEEVYLKKLHKQVPKYVKKNIDKFIGDASFPKKKNRHVLMEEDILNGVDSKKIVKEYGWIKPRHNFSEPFTVAEIKKIRKELKPHEPAKRVKIPKPLQQLFKEVQELVWFRTERTDIFYEFLFLSRPILKRTAEFYKIPFSQIENYSAQSIIKGHPKKYSKSLHALAYIDGEYYFGDGTIIEETKAKEADSVKGTIAYKGVVKGKAKIVHDVSEIDKVKKGDILITSMTSPSYIAAMSRAAAFVTDEGGITCHAAIISREMKKPCVIGTKSGTKIFKDGDNVEVDAENAVVRKV